MSTKRRRSTAVLIMVWIFVTLMSGVATATHWQQAGWTDKHVGYPVRPNGLAQLNYYFGPACGTYANWHNLNWTAADNGVSYAVRYNNRLGGSWSSNLANDVRGHIGNNHLDPYVKSGIWGYNCRYVSGTTKYSVHSWGAAVDTNAAYEHYGHCHNHTIPSGVSAVWQQHNWYWGLYFGGTSCDAMHFQYATGY